MHRLAVAVLSVVVSVSISHAQNSDPNNDTGIHPYETYDGVRESINLGTGNVLVSVPLLTIPGRHGHNYSVTLTSNSQTWSPNSGGYPQSLGMVFSSSFSVHPTGVINPATDVVCVTGYVLSDQSGGVHSLGGIQSNCIQTGGGPNQGMRLPQYDILSGGDDRGEGITVDLNTSACRVTFRDGSWFPLQTGTNGCPLMGMANTPSLIDSNGNGFSLGPTSSTCSGGLFCGGGDTLPGSSGVIQYNDSSGVQRTISLILQAVSLSSCVVVKGGVSTPLSGTYNLISGAVLPNGLTYIFHYDQCGSVDKIVYPSGGYTRYVFDYTHYLRSIPHYSGGYSLAELTAKYVCRAATVAPGATSTAAGNTCPVSEDPTVYSPTTGGSANSANQVTDPLGNLTKYQFATCGTYPYTFACEISRQTYQGSSTLLRTIQTSYSGYYPASKTTILPNGLQTKVEWNYWTLDNVKEKREYAWGNGTPERSYAKLITAVLTAIQNRQARLFTTAVTIRLRRLRMGSTTTPGAT